MPNLISFCPAFVSLQSPVKDVQHGASVKTILFAKTREILSRDFIARGAHKREFSFNARETTPIFPKHISHIVGMRSKKKMVWPHADRIVAMMTNMKFVVKNTVSKFVRKTMGIFLHNDSLIVNKEPSVGDAFSSSFTNPNPAFGSFSNFAPEAFFNRFFVFHKNRITPSPLSSQHSLFCGGVCQL